MTTNVVLKAEEAFVPTEEQVKLLTCQGVISDKTTTGNRGNRWVTINTETTSTVRPRNNSIFFTPDVHITDTGRYLESYTTTTSEGYTTLDTVWNTTATSATSITNSIERLRHIGDKYQSWMTSGTGDDITWDERTNTLSISGSTATTWKIYNDYKVAQVSPEQVAAVRKYQLKQEIRNNLLIRTAVGKRSALALGVSQQEIKARNTLRDMLSEAEYRRYLTNSFIMVRGASNRWYQVFNDSSRLVQVYEKNVKVGTLCIHTQRGECPPTDHVTNMKVLIELDETGFMKLGNYRDLTKDANFIFGGGGITTGGMSREGGEKLAAFAKRLKTGLGFSVEEAHALAC